MSDNFPQKCVDAYGLYGSVLQILKKCDIVTTPGSGFGPAGEGFVRASAFAHRSV